MTSGFYGKPCADWALPGVAGERVAIALCRVDDQCHVVKSVNTRLIDILDWLQKDPSRISDERASSGSESDASEHAEETRSARLCAVRAGDYTPIPRPKEKA